MDDPKCDACNRVQNLKPCGFCGQPVVIRYNTMTGEHYISHEDWNSKCPQKPFYGSAEQWNARHTEDMLLAEIGKWIEAANFGIALINEQQAQIKLLRDALKFYADRSNWLPESDDGGYVNRIEWNACGDLWRAPWKTAEHALAVSHKENPNVT